MPEEYIKLVVIIGFVVLKVESWQNPLVEMLDFIHDTNDRSEFDTPKPETPSEEEIFATKEDQYYSIYERSRLQPKILSTNVVYRIKSLNDSRPSECTETGKVGSRIVCPTTKYGSRWWSCILPEELCDGIQNCDNGEDENPLFCMFYTGMIKQLESTKKEVAKIWAIKSKKVV